MDLTYLNLDPRETKDLKETCQNEIDELEQLVKTLEHFCSGLSDREQTACEPCLRLAKSKLRLAEDTLENLPENEPCPECGLDQAWRNSSDELQCDNCGYSETE